MRRRNWHSRLVRSALALLGSIAMLITASPTAAAQPANYTFSGFNLTLVVAHCERTADTAVAEALAAHSRHAALVCIEGDSLAAPVASLIADFAPDRVLVVGGGDAVPESAIADLASAARTAYRWSYVTRFDGATRIETAAAAARTALGAPNVKGPGAVTLFVADGWNDHDVESAATLAASTDNAAVAYVPRPGSEQTLPADTASIIRDYQPRRVVLVGPVAALNSGLEDSIAELAPSAIVERIVSVGPSIPESGWEASTERARTIFEGVRQRNPRRGGASGESTAPFLAYDLPYLDDSVLYGDFVWTVRADGADRTFRAPHTHGWGWLATSGEFYWTGPQEATMDASVDATDIFVSSADGGQRRHVRTGADWVTWSPREDRFAFFETQDRDGDQRIDSAELWIADADGANARRIDEVGIDTVGAAFWRDQLWSPDGEYLAYDSETADPETMEITHSVRIEPADGSAPPFTLGEEMHFRGWSPDGEFVAYGGWHDCDGDERRDSLELWISERDGGSARSLGWIDGHSQWHGHFWSPDGTQIAVDQVDPEDCSIRLRVHDTAGADEPVTIADDAHVLSWSPSSSALAFASGEASGGGRPADPQGWLTTCVCPTARPLGDLSGGWVFWSPDGGHVAYNTAERDAAGEVVQVAARIERIDGANSVHVGGGSRVLSWSPDGRQIAYTSLLDDDGDGAPERRSLLLHGIDGPEPPVTLVHDLAEPVWRAYWSPQGDYIAYAMGSADAYVRWLRWQRNALSLWTVATTDPSWSYQLSADFDWLQWQPQVNTGGSSE